MTELSGYAFSVLRESDLTLYRGSGDGLDSVLLVVPARESSARESFKRLEHEYALKAALDPDWAARPMALVPHDGRMALQLEDPGGEPLDRLLGRPLEVTEFLRIALPLAAALRRMHARGLIHKDIKPANVLVDVARGGAWLTGFGIASRLPREHRAPEPPEVIAGTLAYMAPEQTGRMNRSIDSRSDLYALGVTLYEMLTSVLPFTASDPMEWVHCHIARQPMPPGERVPAIPAQLSAIVMKLLAKTAEERYQTAGGVEADLRRCLAAWESAATIEPFPLGTQDTSDRLMISERLYGREREIDALLAAFDRVVAHGTTELVLVSGPAGIGKSSVVNELHKRLVPTRGLFAAGKFDQYQRGVPYATLARAFQGLVRPLLGQSEEMLGRWRDAFQEALGPNGQLIVNLVPGLELVIGAQPPVPDLPPQDTQNRFQMVFRRFLGMFARPEHPLVLFLDDLQWLDAATLELLEHLATHPDVRHLLLVGAYRDNEVGPAHPLLQARETIRKTGGGVQHIVLDPLSVDDTNQLLCDALRCGLSEARPLAELVHQKTGGNPFFAGQFLTSLADEGFLEFDPRSRSWTWNLVRIQGQGYTDNVVDLIVDKLKRLPAPTQDALTLLACVGNQAAAIILETAHGGSPEALQADLSDAVRAGFVLSLNGSYKFLHDRIQEAAYALIPDDRRAVVRLGIGRRLLNRMTPDDIATHLFDVVNQLNHGAGRATLLTDPEERRRVAELNLSAGRRAKASTAYASSCFYLSVGMTLLGSVGWQQHYALAFGLGLERAECELLSGNFALAEQLIAELLRRAVSNTDRASAYRLRVVLHVTRSEYQRAVDSALECLRLFGIEMPPHPTNDQVQVAYDEIGRSLGERSIESLIDLPQMTDPDMLAAMAMLSDLSAPAHVTDRNLVRLNTCQMVNLSLTYGTTGASPFGYAWFGVLLGFAFHRYTDGDRFGQLAVSLVQKHGFLAARARPYLAAGLVAFWTQPITTAVDLTRAALDAGVEAGDHTFACYSYNYLVADLLARGDRLDDVWETSEQGLAFARKVKFRDAADIVVGQQRFIQNMRGRTTHFSTFSDAQFDEAAFEAQLTPDRMATMICWYWVLKLQARFMSGDYQAATAAAAKAQALLWSSDAQIHVADYHFYSALAIAAAWERTPTAESCASSTTLTEHREQLREWADKGAAVFRDRHALVEAEVARVEGRGLDAERLYEEAIRLAHEHGLIQNEGLANELAGRFYATRGLAKVAHVYLRDARYCYLRWGAEGKVRQLEQLHPNLREEPALPHLMTTIETPLERLDLAAVVKMSQTVSGEIVLEKLIDTLLVIAVEHAGAERGLLILPHREEQRIEAEATTGRYGVAVRFLETPAMPSDLPDSILRYVWRTQESVILDDASAENPFSTDDYIRDKHARSILCLPLVKQTKLIGILYLENSLASHVFTPERFSVLRLLSWQAAISLENASLYRDRQKAEAVLRESEQRFRDYAETASDWLWETGPDHRFIQVSERETTFGIDSTSRLGATRWELASDVDAEPEKWRLHIRTLEAHEPFRGFTYQTARDDGSVVYIATSGKPVFDAEGRFCGYRGVSSDVTPAVRADQAEQALHQAQAELAHITRVTTMGELASSIAHEVNQPLAAVTTSGNAGLRWLASDPPNLEKARTCLTRIVRDATRASEIIARMRKLAKKSLPAEESVDVVEVIQDALAMANAEIQRHDVTVRVQRPDDVPPASGDRIQLHQVILNLVMNAIDAMKSVTGRPRQLLIRCEEHEPGTIRVAVRDSGIGVDPLGTDRIFEAFYTTKPDGLGMGLAISRSIIEAHGGRLWTVPNDDHGATFQFTLPTIQ